MILVASIGGCGGERRVADDPPAPSTTIPAPATSSTTTPSTAAHCSARTPSDPPSQPGLPDPVEATRRMIVAAAVACDFERLEQIADDGDDAFTFSFGGGDAAAEYWRVAEDAGDEPLRYLSGVLSAPHGVVTEAEPDQFVWPSAFSYERWSEVPGADRRALLEFYTEQDLQGFAEFGSYAGYRVGIAADGEWLFFVAGD